MAQLNNYQFKMGNCAGRKQPSLSKAKSYYQDQQPLDTETFNKPNPQLLEFELNISNIKIKNSGYKSISVSISIEDILNLNLPSKSCQASLKWKYQSKHVFLLSQYSLRKKFITFSVFNEDNQQVTQLRLNLYLISTGPYHQDFPLRFTNKNIGRLSLDLKLSQIVEIEIKSYKARIHMLKQHPGEAFHYTLKTITHEYKEVESSESYPTETQLYNKKIDKKNQQELTPLKIKKNKSQLIVEEGQKIKWSQEEAKRQQTELPSLKSRILMSQIPDESFQLLIWKSNTEVYSSQEQEEEQIVNLYASCDISFNKIFVKQATIFQKNSFEFELRDVQIQEKIWNHGKLYGSIFLNIRVLLPRAFRQMFICVRTEQGILTTSPVFNTPSDQRISECQQLSQLNYEKKNIQELVIKITKMQNQKRKSQFKLLPFKRGVYEGITKIHKLFQSTQKTSVMIYQYNSKEDLVKGQMTILDIGFKLFQYLEEEEGSISELCWKTLIALMNRGELTLTHMSFTADEKKSIQLSDTNKYLKQKIQTGIHYQTFLYKTLSVVLHCLNKKAILQNQRIFAELFLAYSFFRIPEFRNKLISVLAKKDDPEIIQWKAMESNLNQLALAKNATDPFALMFDWQQHFYKWLTNEQKFTQNYSELQEIMQKIEWKQKMAKRGVTFFYFVVYWINYVQKIVISGNISWQYLPGYTKIVRAFLSQMKIRPILKYPDSLKQASLRLLCNENLINIYLHILFKKTSVLDPMGIIKTMDLLNQYFQYFKTRKRIPTNFDYKFFYAGIKEVLNTDHSFAIGKCLALIYNNYNLFSVSFKKEISMYLMGAAFFKLFLYWGTNVRSVFYHLLLYRVYLQSNILLKQNEDINIVKSQYENNQQIQRRYKKLLTILQNAKITKLDDQKTNFVVQNSYEKEYYKKMKKKIQEKRKKYINMQKGNTIVERRDSMEKYSTEKLNKVLTQRYKSEHFKNFHEVDKVSKTPEDTTSEDKLSSDRKKRKQSSYLQPIVQVQQLTKTRVEKRIRRTSTQIEDFHIPQTIARDLLQYLESAMIEFNHLEEGFNARSDKFRDIEDVPIINVKVPLDEGDIRPDDIDEW